MIKRGSLALPGLLLDIWQYRELKKTKKAKPLAHLTEEDYEEFKKLNDKEGHKYTLDFELRESANTLVLHHF